MLVRGGERSIRTYPEGRCRDDDEDPEIRDLLATSRVLSFRPICGRIDHTSVYFSAVA